MKYMGLNELRESFLTFFESKGHLRLASAPLVPQGDNSILLINAGMTPLKKYFQGTETPPRKRAASCQKCIRTPDIDNVGITARHGTFFEMLGNFSFGDYFKEDACTWAWEYFTEVLEIPADLLWVSVYEEDDEARDIWINKVGLPPERVVKFGKADNFWEHGSGPCGPCSEIYFDRGADKGCGEKDCKVGCDCDRYIEVWNLVFTQFDSDGKGNYAPLATKNIDTGMGLERLACVMQGANNLFEVDTIKSVLTEIEKISGKKYNDCQKNHRDTASAGSAVSFRVITDHIRSSSFMIGDGVLPSNEGRGYVLRRLLRRAARHGHLLGITKPFLHELCSQVIESCGQAYPELTEKSAYIKKTIQTEEESFSKTVEKGFSILKEFIVKLHENDILPGEEVFKLHDTFGFPLDLTREILAEKGIRIDEDKFRELMKKQKETARANQAFKGGWGDEQLTVDNGELTVEFTGYKEIDIETKILAIVKEGKEINSCAAHNEIRDIIIILEKSPFYAESGGQVGDTGFIQNLKDEKDKDFAEAKVLNTTKTPSGQIICHCKILKGVLSKGEDVNAYIDSPRRQAIMRNHTAAHLLQASLQQVLGEHVHQAGSLVDAERCRFDFTHGLALSPNLIESVEELVNIPILQSIPVEIKEMPIEEARKMGAIALFGEKYGDTVRVVNIPGRSIELCGGTHVKNTSEIGLFKIISEASVAAGVRRIEAVTGFGVLELLNAKQEEINKSAEKLKQANSVSQKEIARLNSMIANMQAKSAEIIEVGEKDGIKLLTMKLKGANTDALRQAGDKLKSEQTAFTAVIAGETNILCICDKEAITKGFNAGNIVREIAAVTGGKGGGKPDSAMAGIGDASKIDEALEKLKEL
ncbi:MAG: alanine--tRNA ligase [Oscillospiraceae bacterium]|nr:alanine--tRNA ligase [Oscillospiraceae bacterium]